MPYLCTHVSPERTLAPELQLAAAVVTQVVKDASSRRPDVREEALAFLANPACLEYWEGFLGLRDGVLQAHLQAVLRRGR